jgi:hypothetical protein
VPTGTVGTTAATLEVAERQRTASISTALETRGRRWYPPAAVVAKSIGQINSIQNTRRDQKRRRAAAAAGHAATRMLPTDAKIFRPHL